MNAVERGRRLRELREAAGFKQRQVGAWFDIDGRAVSEWERGKSNPDRRKLVMLDKSYEAGGEVLSMFDVSPTDRVDSTIVADLVTQLAETRQILESLQQAFHEMEGNQLALHFQHEAGRKRLEDRVVQLERGQQSSVQEG